MDMVFDSFLDAAPVVPDGMTTEVPTYGTTDAYVLSPGEVLRSEPLYGMSSNPDLQPDAGNSSENTSGVQFDPGRITAVLAGIGDVLKTGMSAASMAVAGVRSIKKGVVFTGNTVNAQAAAPKAADAGFDWSYLLPVAALGLVGAYFAFGRR